MFHGGGWMMGDIPLHRRFYSNIANYLNMVVVSPVHGLTLVVLHESRIRFFSLKNSDNAKYVNKSVTIV